MTKHERLKQDESIWTEIHNISNVDIKNFTFTAKIDTTVINYLDSDNEDLELGRVILENLIFKNEICMVRSWNMPFFIVKMLIKNL